ncbi:hypothetical protein [Streptomyces hirsutus]|uniref:hypothetical protein n=1 Tax=Streptomyces hirsutus TaxID=35620 RepID=UPI00386BE8CB
MIVAQTNEQIDDLVDNIAREYPNLALGRLHASAFTLPERVRRHANVTGSKEMTDLRDLPVMVSTAKKWSYVKPEKCAPWHWAIVDEACQMRSDALLDTRTTDRVAPEVVGRSVLASDRDSRQDLSLPRPRSLMSRRRSPVRPAASSRR